MEKQKPKHVDYQEKDSVRFSPHQLKELFDRAAGYGRSDGAWEQFGLGLTCLFFYFQNQFNNFFFFAPAAVQGFTLFGALIFFVRFMKRLVQRSHRKDSPADLMNEVMSGNAMPSWFDQRLPAPQFILGRKMRSFVIAISSWLIF